ncbi:hypothetical protein G6F31_020635 [Rhizopus arrhizus]|nr:hypothetical protein G6F31_020635 [Rhizopus arrhizus]
MKREDSTANTTSHASTRLAPAPAATPFITQATGTGKARRRPAQARIGLHGVQRARQCGVHDFGEAVQAVGAVKRDDAHALIQREADLGVLAAFGRV